MVFEVTVDYCMRAVVHRCLRRRSEEEEESRSVPPPSSPPPPRSSSSLTKKPGIADPRNNSFNYVKTVKTVKTLNYKQFHISTLQVIAYSVSLLVLNNFLSDDHIFSYFKSIYVNRLLNFKVPTSICNAINASVNSYSIPSSRDVTSVSHFFVIIYYYCEKLHK